MKEEKKEEREEIGGDDSLGSQIILLIGVIGLVIIFIFWVLSGFKG